jgi:hypothetical protein
MGGHKPPVTRGQITPRDKAGLSWTGRHGVVSLDQLIRKIYYDARPERLKRPASTAADPIGCPPRRMAYRRMEILIAHGLVHRAQPATTLPPVYALTRAGARLVDLPVQPVTTIEAWWLAHSLALVDACEYLLATIPEACGYQTEREYRAEHYRTWRARHKRPPVARFTDGVLLFPDGGREALEVDLSAKNVQAIRSVVERYRLLIRHIENDEGGYNHLYWYAAPPALNRVRTAIAETSLGSRITLAPWPPADLATVPWRRWQGNPEDADDPS